MKNIIIISLVICLIALSGCAEKGLELVPKEKTGENILRDTCTGWSVKENPGEAVKEAIDMCFESKTSRDAKFAAIFITHGSDAQAVILKAREILGDNTQIYGGTSAQRGVITDKGILKISDNPAEGAEMEGKRGIAVMLASSDKIDFGAGSANFKEFSSVQEASKSAVLSAIENAGKTKDEKPSLVLITTSKEMEEEVLEGAESVVGKDTVMLGGTAGGPPRAVFGRNEAYEEGVSMAVIYTALPVGWYFEGGFDVSEKTSGIVTKVDMQTIYEIDNRPALDVYDEWLGGEITKVYAQLKTERPIRDLMTLHPLYRKYKDETGKEYNLFSHPWPKDPNMTEKEIMTSTKIKTGERVYLSNGKWETLLNRISLLPLKAKTEGGMGSDSAALFTMGYICNGVYGAIPESERAKMPVLINHANNNVPFIAPFTSGEQGHLIGIGNKHGNLLTSFIEIGDTGK